MKPRVTGLVLGKFLPLHKGHVALIEFALKHCEKLIVLLCSTDSEAIDGKTRLKWLLDFAANNPGLAIEHLEYDADILPNTSVSSREVSKLWAVKLKELFPEVDIVFSSELYGDYLSEYLLVEHKCFDIERSQVRISASAILKNTLGEWEYIAETAKPFFVKKIVLLGSESTGKSTLAERLAKAFETVHVPEMARDIIGTTKEVVYDDLIKIASLHAQTILDYTKKANRILVCDTDVNITASYSEYLFKKALHVPDWIKIANKADLYIFLDTDCPFIQDGTRLSEAERNDLSEQHKQHLNNAGINYHLITGNWVERFEQAKQLIVKTFYNAPLL